MKNDIFDKMKGASILLPVQVAYVYNKLFRTLYSNERINKRFEFKPIDTHFFIASFPSVPTLALYR